MTIAGLHRLYLQLGTKCGWGKISHVVQCRVVLMQFQNVPIPNCNYGNNNTIESSDRLIDK